MHHALATLRFGNDAVVLGILVCSTESPTEALNELLNSPNLIIKIYILLLVGNLCHIVEKNGTNLTGCCSAVTNSVKIVEGALVITIYYGCNITIQNMKGSCESN